MMSQQQQRPPPMQLDANQVRLLKQQGFTGGLIQATANYLNTVPLKIWVLDNSASMTVRDGHKIVGLTHQNLTTMDCSRWEEAQEEVAFHAFLSGCLGIPTRFNMVTPPTSSTGVQLPSFFSVAEKGPAAVQQELQMARQIMGQVVPTGPATPLAYHIRQIQSMVSQMAPQLLREGKLVSVVLATSGVPTDVNGHYGPAVVSDFLAALRSLEGLPISIVVRLCTDDDLVVDFYNTLDAMTTSTNLSYDVVDDFFGEAIEVYLKNSFLTILFHSIVSGRWGLLSLSLDELDEQTLSYAELRDFCALFFPIQHGWPDPATQWPVFLRTLASALATEQMHFNPITKRIEPWMNLRRLHFVYGRNTPFPPDIRVPMGPQQEPQQRAFYGYGPPQQAQWQQQAPGSFRQQPQQQGSFRQQSQQGQAMPQQYAQTQPPPPQQQQQPPPPQPQSPAHAPPPEPAVSVSKYAATGSGEEGMTQIKQGILRWATDAPAHQNLRPIDQLLGTVPQTLPPAFGIADHAYFKKWKPFAVDALSGRDEAVLKRAVRKTKFFLHPDKLPKDLTNEQAFLCKMLWDIVADAFEAFGGS